MKLLLVNPPDTHGYIRGFGNTPPTHRFSPPLGLMYLQSYLKEKCGDIDVRLFNFQVPRGPSMEDFILYLRRFHPDVVGITVMSAFWYDACELVRTIRRVAPGAKVVGGGPHMWIYPEDSLVGGGLDAIVQGPGEATLKELLTAMIQGMDWNEIRGVLFRSADGGVVKTPARNEMTNVDSLPFPDRSGFRATDYRSIENNGRPTVVTFASRGCPYRCTFCNNLNRVFRPRRADRVVDELLECREMGYRAITFYDDVFTCSREHTSALCREMIARKLDMPWICQTRVDCIDRDLVRQMVEAGCERIQMGVESGVQSILNAVGKQITLEQCREAFRFCREEGAETIAYFMVGLPGETVVQAKRTFEFAEDLDADYVVFTPLIPVPGTPIFDTAVADFGFDDSWWRRFCSKPLPYDKLPRCNMGMDETEMIRLINSFYRRYYSNPSRLVRLFKHLKGFGDLLVKAQAGGRLLFHRQP